MQIVLVYDPYDSMLRVHRFTHPMNDTKRWNQVGQDLDGKEEDDRFGISVALFSDGTIVAAGAHRNNGTGPESGHVRVFAAPAS